MIGDGVADDLRRPAERMAALTGRRVVVQPGSAETVAYALCAYADLAETFVRGPAAAC